MKHFLALMLVLVCLLSLCGCKQKEPAYQLPLSFYYPVAEMAYDPSGSAIAAQVREGKDLANLEAMLKLYLNGPTDPAYANPFPQGLRLVELDMIEDTLYLTVSDELATLSGMRLTLACCCITMTCLDLTAATHVSIQAESALLGGNKTILMNRDCLLLLDQSGDATN